MVQLEPLLCVVTDPMKSVTKLGRIACCKGLPPPSYLQNEESSCWHRRLGLVERLARWHRRLGLMAHLAHRCGHPLCLFASRGIFTPYRSRFCSRRPSNASTATA